MDFLNRTRICLILAAACCGPAVAETYHLSQQGWQSTSEDPQGQYLLAISKIKQQLASGTGREVIEALEQLKTDFPQITSEELDSYIKAEKLYSKGSWYKAGAQYIQFTDDYPDSALQPAAMERIYAIGTAFLQGQKRTFVWVLKFKAFDDGVDFMNKLADRAGNAPIALRALVTLAENQEKRKLMLDAYYTWAEIHDRWPTGQTGRNALLRMAQAMHAAYRGTQYDASVLPSSQTHYEDFVSRYPSYAEDLEISQTLDLITEQIAYKDYAMGYYYERTKKPDSAKMYYTRVIAEWPDSKAAKMAQARLAPDAVPAVKMTLRRRTVGWIESFLDSWFGVQKVAEAVLPEEPQEQDTVDEFTDIDVRESM